MKAGDEVGLRNQSPIQPSSREHVCSLRDVEVLQYGFNKIIVCWTTCLEKRNYFRRSLFSFNHVITQSNLQTRWKWGLETNRSFEKQVALGLSSVMELQLGSMCRFFLRVWKAVLIKTRISGRGEDASEFLTLFGDSAAWDSKGENACFPIIK